MKRRPIELTLASDPRALSDGTAFALLVLVTAGVVGLIALGVVGVPHLLVYLQVLMT